MALVLSPGTRRQSVNVHGGVFVQESAHVDLRSDDVVRPVDCGHELAGLGLRLALAHCTHGDCLLHPGEFPGFDHIHPRPDEPNPALGLLKVGLLMSFSRQVVSASDKSAPDYLVASATPSRLWLRSL